MLWFQTNAPAACLFTRLEEPNLVPVSAEAVIYEAFVCFFLLEISWCFFYCLPGGKEKYLKARRMKNGLIFTFFFSIEAINRNSIFVLPSKQRLHRLCFCRNWAVRNPAGTRKDSYSLVNKQVGAPGLYTLKKNCIKF